MRDTRGTRTKPTRPSWDSDDEEERKDARREVHTRRVTFTPPPPPPAKTAMDEVEDLARKMHGLDIGDVAYSGCYTCLVCLAPATAQAWAPPKSHQLTNTNLPPQSTLPYLPLPPRPSSNSQGTSTCFFCGGTHVMRNCVTAGEYLRAGRIIRDGQYFVFPDHSRIHRLGTETIKQSIDARYASAVTPTPATGSNSIPLSPS